MGRFETMGNPGTASGPEVARGPEVEEKAGAKKEIIGITEKDLRVVVPKVGETTIVLQRNAKDVRMPGAADYGALTPEAAEGARNTAKDYFADLFRRLTPQEREEIEVLVVASDATLIAPEGPEYNSGHKRGLETAQEAMRGIQEAMQGAGVLEGQLLNTSEFTNPDELGSPLEFRSLEPARMLREHPEFVEHLKDKYGSGKELWVQFEQDTEREKRKEMGAEGVEEIAARTRSFLRLLVESAKLRHEGREKRLVVWAVGHYDNISPFVKVDVLGRPATDYLPINAAAGITLEVSADGKVKTQLSGKDFDVALGSGRS